MGEGRHGHLEEGPGWLRIVALCSVGTVARSDREVTLGQRTDHQDSGGEVDRSMVRKHRQERAVTSHGSMVMGVPNTHDWIERLSAQSF